MKPVLSGIRGERNTHVFDKLVKMFSCMRCCYVVSSSGIAAIVALGYVSEIERKRIQIRTPKVRKYKPIFRKSGGKRKMRT